MPKNISPDKCSILGKIGLLIRVSKATDELNYIFAFLHNVKRIDILSPAP
jgi:hypothetical protein